MFCLVITLVLTDQKLALFNEHKSYVQGVALDPLGEYVATLSADRLVKYHFHFFPRGTICVLLSLRDNFPLYEM